MSKKKKVAAASGQSVEERLAVLEAFVAKYFGGVITVNDPVYGEVSGLVEVGRRGGDTDFWMRTNIAEGALRSYGNGSYRFGVYIENEGLQSSLQNPSTALYAAALAKGPRPSIGVHGIAGGASDRNGISQNYAGLFESSGRSVSIQREGFQLFGNWDRVVMGPAGGPYVQLWPVPKAL